LAILSVLAKKTKLKRPPLYSDGPVAFKTVLSWQEWPDSIKTFDDEIFKRIDVSVARELFDG
jgi:hypothetical protein